MDVKLNVCLTKRKRKDFIIEAFLNPHLIIFDKKNEMEYKKTSQIDLR